MYGDPFRPPKPKHMSVGDYLKAQAFRGCVLPIVGLAILLAVLVKPKGP